MLPRHVGVAHALDDVHRAAGLDRPVAEEVALAVLDQRARDDVGLARIARGLRAKALLVQRALLRLAETVGHQVLGHVHGGRDEHHAGEPVRIAALAQALGEQQRHPAAHRRADDDLRAVGESVHHRLRLLQPERDRAVLEAAARAAMAGIVETHAGPAGRRRPSRRAPPPWCRLMSERKPLSQNRPGAAPGRAETAMARAPRPFADLQAFQLRVAHPMCSGPLIHTRCAKRPMPSSPPRRRRTILQVIPSLETGGAERTTIDIAAALAQRGDRALVASARRAHGGRARGGRRRAGPHAGRREEPGDDGDERLPAPAAHPARACRPRACQEPRSRLGGARRLHGWPACRS